MKKGQSISINTIIVAAIALIVLVVIIAIFSGKMGSFLRGIGIAVGDTDKNCADLNPSNPYQPRTLEECNGIEGAQHVVSKDAPGNTGTVCCTR